jgi:DNA-binding response OmpR family regulator
MTTILVVDDEPKIVQLARDYLEHAGFAVLAAGDGRTALQLARSRHPDLVVLDLGLPGLDGLDVTRAIRRDSNLPVIMLTARDDELDKLLGLELGADDYIAKPFSPRELVARVNAVLRRANTSTVVAAPAETIFTADLMIDVAAHVVLRDGKIVSLTAREFDLLVFLASRPRRVFRREELLERVWGYTYGDTATVTVHIRRLREKIERDPASPERLMTVWGVGYRFDV